MTNLSYPEIVTACGQQSQDMGWWADFPGDLQEVQKSGQLTKEQHNWVGNKLMLVVSELVEAHDEIRQGRGIHDWNYDEMTGKPEGFPTEIADVVIRVFDLCYNLGINLPYWTDFKLTYNSSRGHRHGNKVS